MNCCRPALLPPGLPTAARSAAGPAPARPSELDPATLEDRSHPAWQRLKFDELLAQQLSQAQAQAARA